MAKFPKDMPSQLSNSKSQRTKQDKQWSAAIRMLRGDQWFYNDTQVGRERKYRNRKGVVRVTVNQMLNIERSILSRLTLNIPQPVVIPSSDSIDDITKATASEMALRYFWLTDRQTRKWQECVRWLAQTGNCAMHTYYEPDKVVQKAADAMPDEGEVDGPKADKVVGNAKVVGKVKCDVISPFNLFYEPGVNDPKEARWVAIRSYSTKEELLDTYPDKKEDIEKLTPISNTERKEFQTYSPAGRIEVFECYWRDGRHAIMAGSYYLATEFSEDVRDAFPITHIRYHVINGDLWGQGPMVQITDLQQLYNRTRTQIHQNVRLMGNPPWLIPRTADVRNGAIMNQPGACIEYTPGGGAPSPANPQQLPAHVLREPIVLREEMSDVAGAHGVTLGRRQPGVKSGVHARTLTQQDSAQLLTTQHEIIAGVEDIMLTVLILMKRNYNAKRLIKMLDEAGVPTWRELSSTDIVDDPEIHIDANTLFKVDASSRESRVLEMVQLGLLSPEEARDAISFRTFNKQVTQKFISLSHAKKMLEGLKTGLADMQIFPTDDFDAFLKVLNEYVQTDEYYELPPEVQDRIAQKIVDIEFYAKPEEQWEAASNAPMVSPHEAPRPMASPKQTAPQLQAVAQPAPQVDNLAGVAFPTEGQNLAGVPGSIGNVEGGV